jgi:hypothetical protein
MRLKNFYDFRNILGAWIAAGSQHPITARMLNTLKEEKTDLYGRICPKPVASHADKYSFHPVLLVNVTSFIVYCNYNMRYGGKYDFCGNKRIEDKTQQLC